LNNFPFIKHIFITLLNDERISGGKFAIMSNIAHTLPLSLLENGAPSIKRSKEKVFGVK